MISHLFKHVHSRNTQKHTVAIATSNDEQLHVISNINWIKLVSQEAIS
jgi:hypothetical protein